VPRYPHWTPTTASIAASLLAGRPRSFPQDARRMVSGLRPCLRVEGRLPDLTSGRWLLLANHYSQKGFRAWWIPLAISSLVPRPIHWVMTSTLTYSDALRRASLQPLSIWSLRRIAACYDFTAMPPMPPRPQDVEARARAVRRVLAFIDGTPDPLIGLAPEGGDTAGGVLNRLWPGAGRFLWHLALRSLSFLPIGVYEKDGALCLSIGEPFLPSLPDRRTAQQLDLDMEQTVMHRLAGCLPPELRGEFG
jgi:hypothetical protein